jgi:hypothetical protein
VDGKYSGENMDNSDEKLKKTLFIILILIEILFVLKLFMGGSDSFYLVLIFGTAILMLLLVKISDIKSFDFLGGNFRAEFQNQLDETKKQVDETKDKVEKLFLSTMSGPMYHNLRKLANPPFGAYYMTDGLKKELYHLRDIGYISIPPNGLGSISKIPQKGEDLSMYVNVTNFGEEFIKQRETIEK